MEIVRLRPFVIFFLAFGLSLTVGILLLSLIAFLLSTIWAAL